MGFNNWGIYHAKLTISQSVIYREPGRSVTEAWASLPCLFYWPVNQPRTTRQTLLLSASHLVTLQGVTCSVNLDVAIFRLGRKFLHCTVTYLLTSAENHWGIVDKLVYQILLADDFVISPISEQKKEHLVWIISKELDILGERKCSSSLIGGIILGTFWANLNLSRPMVVTGTTMDASPLSLYNYSWQLYLTACREQNLYLWPKGKIIQKLVGSI